MSTAISGDLDYGDGRGGGGAAIPRRDLLRGAAVGAVGTAAVALAGLAPPADARRARKRFARPVAAAPHDMLADTGVGMYSDMSTAEMTSGFTICPDMLSCAVGTQGLTGVGAPFAMLMYAVSIPLYVVDHAQGVIRAAGRMRSRTMVAGGTVEDIEHDYNAVAIDGRGNRRDRFDVHFSTPFWTPGRNALATPSKEFAGKARFGGEVLMGKVSVRR